jgi:hypothetical protein
MSFYGNFEVRNSIPATFFLIELTVIVAVPKGKNDIFLDRKKPIRDERLVLFRKRILLRYLSYKKSSLRPG